MADEAGLTKRLYNSQLDPQCLDVAAARYGKQAATNHANNLASKIRNNLTNSMKALGVDILTAVSTVVGPQKVKYGKVGLPDTTITAKDIIITTGSIPFVPKGVEVDGSGYIGLEFSDVYAALGSEVTFVEALDQLMPVFDLEIGKLVQRVINPQKINYHTGVFVSKVAEILKYRRSWFRDCRVVDVLNVLPTANGGTIELLYMQLYALTTLALARDFCAN